MDPRFILPISTMLAGLGLWLAYVIVRAFSRAVRGWPAQNDVGVAIVTGGLVAFSSFA